MATKKKAKAGPAATKGDVKEIRSLMRLVQKEHGKIRKVVVDLAADVARLQADLEKSEAVAKEERAKVKRLYADPLYSVPSDLKKEVGEAVAKVNALEMRLAEKVSVDDLDAHKTNLEAVSKKLEEVAHDVGGLQTEGQDLDDRLKAAEGTIDALEDVMTGASNTPAGSFTEGGDPNVIVKKMDAPGVDFPREEPKTEGN